MITLRSMMMGALLMGSAVVALPAMSQGMAGHRGASSVSASGASRQAVERRSDSRSVMGGGQQISRQSSGSSIQQSRSSEQRSSSGRSVLGAGSSSSVSRSNSQASEVRRATQPSVSHWPSQSSGTGNRNGGSISVGRSSSDRNSSSGRSVLGVGSSNNTINRRSSTVQGNTRVENNRQSGANSNSNSVFGTRNDLGNVKNGGSLISNERNNNSGSGVDNGHRGSGNGVINRGGNGTNSNSGKQTIVDNGHRGQGYGNGNAGGNGNRPGANRNNYGNGRGNGNGAPGYNNGEPRRQERFGGYGNRRDFDRRNTALERNHRRGSWHGSFMAPPPRPYRPRFVNIFAPIRPVGWSVRTGVPLIDGILGLTFGMAYDAALNYLYDMSYAIDGWSNDLVYLRDVPLMRFTWPDVMLRFDDARRMSYAQFVYSSPYYDRSRLRTLYSDLCVTYGRPVSFRDDSVTQVSWYGGDGRGYVTLRFSSMSGRYYTTLSYGY